jgi:hypothetical protein
LSFFRKAVAFVLEDREAGEFDSSRNRRTFTPLMHLALRDGFRFFSMAFAQLIGLGSKVAH